MIMDRSLCVFALALLALPGANGVGAQEPIVISGRVVDQTGVPVADLEVLLHRVAGQTGDRIAETTTAEDGSFTFSVTGEQPSGAIYFATASFNEGTYIGPFLEPPLDPAMTYEVVVGGEPISFGTATMPTSGVPAQVRPPASPRRWALAIIPLGALLGVGAAALARRGRRTRRDLLIRLAVLEEEAAANGETDGMRRERARILDQLGGRLAP